MTLHQRIPVVALVSSAGGLEAVGQVLGTLPPDFPAAVIVLRHHSPDAPNRLPPILQTRSALRVVAASEGDRLQPGRVLVAPVGFHTLVTADGTIALIVSGDRPPYRPSADLLLTSMALTVGPRAIAVVMSGYGNDGATGATAVHHFGGVVIASDEATSVVFAMPYATISRDQVVDHVVDVDAIANLLTAVVSAVVAGRPARP